MVRQVSGLFYNMNRTGGAVIPPSVAAAPAPTRTVPEDEVARRELICAACHWNQAWICEHPGCLPCKQRVAGGLRTMLKLAIYHCPAGKFKNLIDL